MSQPQFSAEQVAQLVSQQVKEQLAQQEEQLKEWFQAELRRRDEDTAALRREQDKREAEHAEKRDKEAKEEIAALRHALEQQQQQQQEQWQQEQQGRQQLLLQQQQLLQQQEQQQQERQQQRQQSTGGAGGAGGSEDVLARQEIAQKSVDALSDDVREHRQETLEKLDLQHKALSLQLQMLQRMGAQMEAATEAAMRDMQLRRDADASAASVDLRLCDHTSHHLRAIARHISTLHHT